MLPVNLSLWVSNLIFRLNGDFMTSFIDIFRFLLVGTLIFRAAQFLMRLLILKLKQEMELTLFQSKKKNYLPSQLLTATFSFRAWRLDIYSGEWLTSLNMGRQTSPPNFQYGSRNYFISIPSDKGLGTGNPRSLDIQAIFAIFRILFFSKSRVFLLILKKIIIFYR